MRRAIRPGEQPGGQVRQLVHVLAGVVEVNDLGGLREVLAGLVPDPRRAVAEEGELADVPGAAAAAFEGAECFAAVLPSLSFRS